MVLLDTTISWGGAMVLAIVALIILFMLPLGAIFYNIRGQNVVQGIPQLMGVVGIGTLVVGGAILPTALSLFKGSAPNVTSILISLALLFCILAAIQDGQRYLNVLYQGKAYDNWAITRWSKSFGSRIDSLLPNIHPLSATKSYIANNPAWFVGMFVLFVVMMAFLSNR